jgi:hypothetical protein
MEMHGLIKAHANPNIAVLVTGSKNSTKVDDPEYTSSEPSSSAVPSDNLNTKSNNTSQIIPKVLQKISTITESSVLKKLPKEHIRLQFVEKLKQNVHSGYFGK